MEPPNGRITDLPLRERPRERLHDLGPDGLSSIELLAVLVGSGGRSGSALSVAQELLRNAGCLTELGRMDPLEMARHRGIGKATAARILAGLELGRRSMGPAEDRPRVEGPDEAAALLLPHYQNRDREHFGILVLDSRNGVIARRTVAVGSLNASLVHPREVFRPAVVLRAARLLLFHNHPSGDPTPSPEDVNLTRRLVELGRVMGIEVLDHVVLGRGRWESLREGQKGLF